MSWLFTIFIWQNYTNNKNNNIINTEFIFIYMMMMYRIEMYKFFIGPQFSFCFTKSRMGHVVIFSSGTQKWLKMTPEFYSKVINIFYYFCLASVHIFAVARWEAISKASSFCFLFRGGRRDLVNFIQRSLKVIMVYICQWFSLISRALYIIFDITISTSG